MKLNKCILLVVLSVFQLPVKAAQEAIGVDYFDIKGPAVRQCHWINPPLCAAHVAQNLVKPLSELLVAAPKITKAEPAEDG
jgi:hypothetical protein